MLRSGLLCATILTAFPAAPAFAQQNTAAEPAKDEIVVTGTRGRGRTVLDSPVPVDVITASQITQSGTTGELAQALQNLTPSLNFPRQSNSGTGDTVRAAQLRGMSPDQTLVLVNGKRYHTTSVPNFDAKIGRGTTPVDLNSLPINAVARTEILRDGAGAQYGSDAIAGVINFGLDRITSGGSVGVTYGLNVTRPGAVGYGIQDGQTFVVDAKTGFKIGENGFFSFGGDYIFQQGTNRAGFDQGGQFLTGGSYSDPRNDRFFGRRLFKVGDPRVESGHLWYNTEVEVGDASVYSFGIGHYREARGANFFRWPVIVDGNGNDYAAPNQPNGLDGFRPESQVRNGDMSLTAGVKGEAGGWRLDGSATYGVNNVTSRLGNSLNYSLGASSPNAFQLGSFRTTQFVINLDAAREIDAGLATPLTVAAGAEYRRDTWASRAGDAASYAVGPLANPTSLGLTPGAQAGPGLTPADARSLGRDVFAVYAELSGELVSRVFLDVAGRVEHYSDAGTAVAGKAAARWEVAPGIALRGSVSNSFRAPALAQLGASATSLTFGAGGALQRIATLPFDSPQAVALGAEKLRPERSFNLSAGITVAPAAGLRLSVDAFRIRVDNRVTLSERFLLDGLTPAQVAALGLTGFGGVAFYTNAVSLETRGVEAVLAYTRLLAGGTFNINASYSYFDNRIRRVTPPPPQLAANGIPGALVGVEETNTLTTAAPNNKLVVQGDWRGPVAGGLLRVSRYGSATRVFNFGGGFEPRQVFPAAWQVDAEIQLLAIKGMEIAIGGTNLFDKYPNRSIDDINGAGNLAYDFLSPIGINGRYLYARARVNF